MLNWKLWAIIGLAIFVMLGVAACRTGSAGLLNLTIPKGTFDKTSAQYGELDRQRLDIYEPDGGATETPVVVFIHGGGWDSGEEGMYLFVGEAFASEGFTTVLPTYRLAPEGAYPVFMEDAAKSVAWVKDNIAGDRPIVLVGHSAGAHMAALLVLDTQFLEAEGVQTCDTISAVVGNAGPYDFEINTPDLRAAFPAGTDRVSMPIEHIREGAPNFLLIHSRDDDVVGLYNLERLSEALMQKDVDVETEIYDGLSHVDTVTSYAKTLRGKSTIHADTMDYIRRKGGSVTGCQP